MNRMLRKENSKRKKNILIISIISTLIVLMGSVYAFFTYFKSAQAFILTSNSIMVEFIEGTNELSFTNAYPISDEFALENLSKLDYIDFTVHGNATNSSEAITYEIFLTKDANNRLDSNYIKTYVTDGDGNKITEPTTYNSLSTTTYANEPTGKVVLEKTYAGDFTKNYRLYVWLDKDYEQNIESQTFTFYVHIYAYNDEPPLTVLKQIQELAKNNPTYIKNYTTDYINNASYTYNGSRYDTQDTIADRTRSEKKDVYYYTGSDALEHGNVLFGGYCWQIVRTTDTGGLRLIYNGIAENNQCLTTRSNNTYKGINSQSNATVTMNSGNIYGKSYTYDLDAGTFTLQDVMTNKNWSSDYQELIGTYTCNSSNTTCQTLYYVGTYYSTTQAYTTSYTIGNIDSYKTLGKSSYNSEVNNPSLVGYMFNNAYSFNTGLAGTGKYANTVTWNGSKYIFGSDTSSKLNSTHRYICYTSACDKILFYINSLTYLILENGDISPLYAMFNYKQEEVDDYNINVYNSTMKGYLENWYKNNISGTGSERLIDTSSVYCNSRKVRGLNGGWNDRDFTSTSDAINFSFQPSQDDIGSVNLICENATDRFSTENLKAKLMYSVGLATVEEVALMGVEYAIDQNTSYFLITPCNAGRSVNVNMRFMSADVDQYWKMATVEAAMLGVRPVITLRPDALFSDGDGTYESPYIVTD